MTIKDIITVLENKWVAVIVSLTVLLFFYNLYPETWQFLFTVLLAYLIADVIKSILIKGGKGIIQFPFTGTTETKPEGHGYLIFLIYIVIGTIFSAKMGEYIMINHLSNLEGMQSILIPNIVIITLVYIDFHIAFKRR